MKLNRTDLERKTYTSNLPEITQDKNGRDQFLYPVWEMRVQLVPTPENDIFEDGAYFIYRIANKSMFAAKINKYTRDPDFDPQADAIIKIKDRKMISFEPFEEISAKTDRVARVKFERHSADSQTYVSGL